MGLVRPNTKNVTLFLMKASLSFDEFKFFSANCIIFGWKEGRGLFRLAHPATKSLPLETSYVITGWASLKNKLCSLDELILLSAMKAFKLNLY